MTESKLTSPRNLLIVDYGMGNLNSVKRAVSRITHTPTMVSSRAQDIIDADKIILPGIGHFGSAMSNLKQRDLLDSLNEAVMVKRTPILGICLGMELMAKKSEEGNAAGFGWIDADAVRFKVSDKDRYKIPHMGWNQVQIKRDGRLMSGISETSEFYFAHSYYLKLNDRTDLLSETQYEVAFASAVEKDNIFGVQFHPEKSHDAGSQVLKNFIEL